MLKLVEHYEELVERHSSEVSYAWKASVIVAYTFSSVSSYICAIGFNSFWFDVSGGHCFFWADVELHPKASNIARNLTYMQFLALDEANVDDEWVQEIFVIHQEYKHCRWFQFSCLLSFAVATVMIVMFTMCGRGGHETSLFVAPWRIVVPALVISLTMMILTMHTTHDFTYGFLHFSGNLYQLAHRVLQTTHHMLKYNRACEAFQAFTKTHNIYDYDSCWLYSMVEYSSWVMTWGWIASFLILSLRILTSADFSLLKVKIYEVPQSKREKQAIIEKVYQSNITSANERIRLKKKVFDENAKRDRVL